MNYITPIEASDFLKETGIRVQNIYTMTDEKQLYTIRRMGELYIPIDAFVRLLDYNPMFRDAFCNYIPADNDLYMEEIKGEVMKYMNSAKPICDEEYSLEQLEKIFGVTKKRIRSEMWNSKHRWRHLFRHDISVTEILIYLKNHPDALKRLQERHDLVLSSGGMYEAPIRHILMLYSYYEGYGYII